MTLSEIAFLTAIPNNPTRYNLHQRKENTLERRDLILQAMKEQGSISETVYQEALQEEIVLQVEKEEPNTDSLVVCPIQCYGDRTIHRGKNCCK